MIYDLGLFLTAVISASVASVCGFGIGSLITPVLSLAVTTKIAVAIVAIPHFIATAIRFWMLRGHIDKKVFIGFGLMSAIGGLCGALLHGFFATPSLTLIFGCILVFAGIAGVTDFLKKINFSGASAWLAGGFSGFLGGMVGNQGGIRSAALLGFQLSKETFVATATAIGLVVDAARIPVYLTNEWSEIIQNQKWIGITTLGVILGTLIGSKIFKKIPQMIFSKTVSSIILVLGLFMLYKGLR